MLRVLYGGVTAGLLAVLPGLVPSTTSPPGGFCEYKACEGDPSDGAEAGSESGEVEVTVWGSGVTSDGGSFEVASSTHRAAAACGYRWFATGQEYASWWTADGRFTGLQDALPVEDQFAPWPGYRDHADDTQGAWWVPRCSDVNWSGTREEFVAYRNAYMADHDAVYVEAGQAPPASEVSPEVLAQIAYESMDLPQGVIRWSPSLQGQGLTVVNTDTWVWVEGAPTSVSVTAQIASGTWARVDATVVGMEVSAPGAGPASCADTGTAWAAGAAPSCSIRFTRSSANQPVKTGQSLPTSTLTASATWRATWVSSLDATPRPLPDQSISTMAEVPVAEIESVVVSG